MVVEGREDRSGSTASNIDETAFPFTPDDTPEPDNETGTYIHTYARMYVCIECLNCTQQTQ